MFFSLGVYKKESPPPPIKSIHALAALGLDPLVVDKVPKLAAVAVEPQVRRRRRLGRRAVLERLKDLGHAASGKRGGRWLNMAAMSTMHGACTIPGQKRLFRKPRSHLGLTPGFLTIGSGKSNSLATGIGLAEGALVAVAGAAAAGAAAAAAAGAATGLAAAGLAAASAMENFGVVKKSFF